MPEDSQFIGRFRVTDTLGIGGMGVVYAARDPDIGRKVAIKVLHTTGNPLDLERFKNEACTIGDLTHPNIVVLLEYGIDDNRPFLVMEYLPGLSLDNWIEQSHKLGEHKDLLIDLCHALKYAHENNILHRDLKPGNVQVLPGGQAKLLDFGIAQARETGLTASGVVMGTPKYLAPEVLQNEIHTKSSDCYSLSLIAYSMLCGKNPFSADTFHAAVIQQLTITPTPLHQLNPDIPKKLSDVIEQYLDKDPENRPSSPDLLEKTLKSIVSDAELNRDIIPVKNDSGSDATLKTIASQTQPEKKGKNRLLLIGGLNILIVAAILSFFMVDRFTSREPVKDTPTYKAEITQPTQMPTVKEQPVDKSLNDDLRNETYTPLPDTKELNTVDTTKLAPLSDITIIKEEASVNVPQDIGSAPEPEESGDIVLGNDSSKEQEVKNKQVVAIRTPPEPKPPVTRKPVTSHNKKTEKPPRKPVMVTAPPRKAQVRSYEPSPIIVLPDLALGLDKIAIKSPVDLEISRGKTKKIILDVPENIEINEFKIFRAGKELKQIKIRKIRQIGKNKVQLNLYADNNAILGVYSIYGIYKGKKTTPVTLKVTL